MVMDWESIALLYGPSSRVCGARVNKKSLAQVANRSVLLFRQQGQASWAFFGLKRGFALVIFFSLVGQRCVVSTVGREI